MPTSAREWHNATRALVCAKTDAHNLFAITASASRPSCRSSFGASVSLSLRPPSCMSPFARDRVVDNPAVLLQASRPSRRSLSRPRSTFGRLASILRLRSHRIASSGARSSWSQWPASLWRAMRSSSRPSMPFLRVSSVFSSRRPVSTALSVSCVPSLPLDVFRDLELRRTWCQQNITLLASSQGNSSPPLTTVFLSVTDGDITF